MKSDRQIQRYVMEQLTYDPSIHSQKIGVSVEGGVVTLSGTVPSYVEKYLAEKRAFISGVNAVVENIIVELPEHKNRSDLDLAKALAETLEWHVRVPTSIKVSVTESVVTLTGNVEWSYQKEAALETVKHTKGVKGINNMISILVVPKTKDIKGLIEKALTRSAQDDAKGIDVQVVNDKVVLSGNVHSQAELDDAKWAAWA
ncbi:MAG: BON domain-containing protein, partial [Chitinophagaceae bacterium]|nr:BON domain-containing protein [Oligoflexus sp.]